MNVISADLEKRIEAGRAWLKAEPNHEFQGPKIRGYRTTVRLKEVIDSPERVERFGLGFVVTVHRETGNKSFQLIVRIKPQTSEGPKATSNPYVIIYIKNQNTDAEDAIICEHLVKDRNYKDIAKLDTKAWFGLWINRALRQESGKFFRPENRIN